MDMLQRLLHTPRANVEVGVAIPIGCMVPLAIAAAALVGAGVLAGARLSGGGSSNAGAESVTLRIIDDGARGGPQVLATAIVPLR